MGAKLQDDELVETHEINVTPFIDVMLVLLIIFMVAAPLATVEIKVDLPAASEAPQPNPDTPLTITLHANKRIVIDERTVQPEALADTLLSHTNGDTDTRIFLQADKQVTYEALMHTMNIVRGAGYLKIALVAEEAAQKNDA